MWTDHEKAASILETMFFNGRLDDTSLLVDIHQGIASSMMSCGRIEEAEKHLIRAINLGIPGMREAMEKLTDD